MEIGWPLNHSRPFGEQTNFLVTSEKLETMFSLLEIGFNF
jgi:hypothetical protein